MVVKSFDDADEILDLGDQMSESLAESLAEEDGGVREASYGGNRLCEIKGFNWQRGLLYCRWGCPIGPVRDGGGDIGFCCGDWNPRTCREDNSASVSRGESCLMASQNRCARATRMVFGTGSVADGDDCNGDMIGVSGGVTKPRDVCVCADAAAVDTDTVAIT
jgi:hypothetical protein